MTDRWERRREKSRRKILGALSASVTLGLAGCSDNSGATDESTTDTSTTEPNKTATESESTTEAETESPEAGSELWTIDPAKDRFGGPTVGNGFIYILMGGMVHAFNARSGEAVATADVGYETDKPVVVDESLYAPANGQITALDATETLDEQWRAEGFHPSDSDDPEARQYSFQEPAVIDDSVFAIEQWPDKEPFILYHFDRDTGERRWAEEISHSSDWVAATTETVYVADRRGSWIAAREPSDGTERWRNDPDGRLLPPLVIDNGTAYVGVAESGGSGYIQGLDSETGAEIEVIDHSGSAGRVQLDQDYFYVDGRSNIKALSRSDNSQVWEFDKDGITPLGIGSERVYIAHGTTVYAYEKASWAEKWTASVENEIRSRPIYAEGTVYIKDVGGIIYAFEG